MWCITQQRRRLRDHYDNQTAWRFSLQHGPSQQHGVYNNKDADGVTIIWQPNSMTIPATVRSFTITQQRRRLSNHYLTTKQPDDSHYSTVLHNNMVCITQQRRRWHNHYLTTKEHGDSRYSTVLHNNMVIAKTCVRRMKNCIIGQDCIAKQTNWCIEQLMKKTILAFVTRLKQLITVNKNIIRLQVLDSGVLCPLLLTWFNFNPSIDK